MTRRRANKVNRDIFQTFSRIRAKVCIYFDEITASKDTNKNVLAYILAYRCTVTLAFYRQRLTFALFIIYLG